uniref:Uncharacterized protein n=1 Tax=Arundo donax TaxID=35708 RepID=A0A0A9HF55_ARUDO
MNEPNDGLNRGKIQRESHDKVEHYA